MQLARLADKRKECQPQLQKPVEEKEISTPSPAKGKMRKFFWYKEINLQGTTIWSSM